MRGEFENQLKLIQEIESLTHFDGAALHALRKKLQAEEFPGVLASVEGSSRGPVTVTNQWAFERYRSVLEVDLKQDRGGWGNEVESGSFAWAMKIFSEWSGRYGRRQQIISGEFGKLGDTAGIEALMRRNRAMDEAVSGIPDWGAEMHGLLQMIGKNPHSSQDAPFDQPHNYGPSFRRLWLEAERNQQEPWQAIREWKSHIPGAWEQEDRRKKQGLAYSHPESGQRLGREIEWQSTGESMTPWAAEVDGEKWQIRLNNFPDEILYTLLIDGEPQGDFHDWPENWKR